MAVIGTATVRVTPDTTGFTNSSFRSKMAKYGKLAGAALAAGLIIETKKAVQQTQDLTKTTLNLHKTLGLTVKASSEWGAALQARGADAQKAGMAFKTFATQLSSAGHGSASAIAMFKELGFSQADIQRAMTDTEFGLKKVADGLQQLPAGADKATFAGKLFGRGWQTIAPMMRDGSAALQENLNTTKKYGDFLTTQTFKQQKTLLFNLRDNKLAWQGLQVQLATAVTPALNTVSDQFQKIAKINADPNLTGEEKWKRISTIIEDDFNKALDVVTHDVLPQLASNVGQAAPKVAASFADGFLHADTWGKLAIGAWLLTKFGGWGAATKLGIGMGARVEAGMGLGLVEGSAIPAAAGAAGAGTLAGRLGTALKGAGAIASRSAGIATGLLLADQVTQQFQATMDAHSGDLQKSLEGISAGGGKPLQQKIVDDILGPFAGDALEGSKAADRQQRAAQQLLGVLGRIEATHGHIGKALLREALHDQKILDLNGEQNAELNKQLQIAQRFQARLSGRRQGFGFAAALAEDGKLIGPEVNNILDKLGQLEPGARKEAANTMVGMAKVLEQKGKLPEGSADALRTAVTKTFKKLRLDSVSASFHQAKGVAQNMAALETAVTTGMQLLGKNTNKSLEAFGVKALKFTLENPGKAGGAIGGLVHGVLGLQTGGGIRVPGSSVGDNHLLSLDGMPIAKVESKEIIHVTNRKRAEELERGNAYTPRYAEGGIVPKKASALATMIAEANKFEAHHFPYVLGGGHAGFGIQPVDCSGFVSDVLHSAGLLQVPMVSGALMNWGKPGTGPLTVYANPDHTFMSLAGRFAGTSGSNPGGGAGWVEGGYPPSYLSGFAARTMDVGGAAGAAFGDQLARVLLSGPDGPLKDMGQAALDRVRKAANSYIASKAPAGTLGGGDPGEGATPIPVGGGWIGRVGATEEGLTGNTGASGVPVGSGFAELLVAGANAGMWQQDLAATLGLPNKQGWGMGSPGTVGPNIGIRMPGSNKAFSIPKTDIGSGQAGDPHYKIDLQAGPIRALGWSGNADVEVKKLAKGGGIDIKHLLHDLGHIGKKGKRHARIGKLLDRIKELGVPEHLTDKIKHLDRDSAVFADLADRAVALTGDSSTPAKVTGPGGKALDEAGWLGKELDALWPLRNALVDAEKILGHKSDRVKKLTMSAEGARRRIEQATRHANRRIRHLEAKDKLSPEDRRKLERLRERGLSPAESKRLHELHQKKHLTKHERGEVTQLEHKQLTEADRKEFKKLSDLEMLSAKERHELAHLRDVSSDKRIRLGALTEDIIPGLRDRSSKLRSTGSDWRSKLDDVQGIGSPMERFKKLISPVDPRFGGELQDVQITLRDLGQGSSANDLSGFDVGALQEFAKLVRVGAFETDPFGSLPQFHQGGQFRSPSPGGEGLAWLRDREWITPDENVGPAAAPYVHVSFANGMEWLRDFMKVEIRQHQHDVDRAELQQLQAEVLLP